MVHEAALATPPVTISTPNTHARKSTTRRILAPQVGPMDGRRPWPSADRLREHYRRREDGTSMGHAQQSGQKQRTPRASMSRSAAGVSPPEGQEQRRSRSDQAARVTNA